MSKLRWCPNCASTREFQDGMCDYCGYEPRPRSDVSETAWGGGNSGNGPLAGLGQELAQALRPVLKELRYGGDGAVKNATRNSSIRNIVTAESILPPQTAKLTWRTAQELGLETAEEVPWIVPGMVAQGAITEIDGWIKEAGKTTLLLHLAAAVIEGKPFLGYPTVKTPVVFLTEQPDTSFREALEKAGLLGCTDLIILSRHRAVGVLWEQVIAQAIAKCKEIEAKLLIVDTLPQWAGIEGEGENSAGEALKVMRPLQDAAGLDNLAVIITRHERKSGGKVGQAARGSSAFGGTTDIIFSLRRPEGNTSPNMRVLHGLSRFSETPDTLVIELTEAGYQNLGTETAVAIREAEREILDAAPQVEAMALTQTELLAVAKVKRTSGQAAIRNLIQSGKLERFGEGKKGSPYRYWGPEMLLGTTFLGLGEQTERLN